MNRVALQMLVGDRAKYLGLIFGITFATLLIAQQTSIFVGLMQRTTSQIIDVHEADVWVMDPTVIYFDEIEPLPDTALGLVRGVSGTHWATPLFKANVVARARGGRLQQVIMLGVDDASLAGAPPRMLLGSVENLRQPDALILDRAGFEFIWPGEPLALGKELELNDRRAVVVGICEAAAPFVTFPVVYTRFGLARSYAPPTRNQMSFVIAKPAAGVSPAELAQRIRSQTGLQARTWDEFAWMTVNYYLTRTGIPVNFGITIGLGFLVGVAIAGQTFYLFVVENMRQFGALKAIGVGNFAIVRMVLLQALVVGLLGFGIGVGLSALFFELTSPNVTNLRGFYMPWQVMAGTGVAVMTIILIVSVVSIRKVLVVDPAMVFRG